MSKADHMRKIVLFLISLSFTGIVCAAVTFEPARSAHALLLRDGFILNGTEGRLVDLDKDDVWFFELAADVNDSRVVVKAGTKLQLLPSTALEQMIADNRKDPTLTYQLWGARITKYKGKNFIFPNFFLSLKRAVQSESVSPQKTQDQAEPQQTLEPELTDPNSVLSIPPDILQKLRARRQKITDSGQRITVDEERGHGDSLQRTKDALRASALSVLADRTGFIKVQADGQFVFVPDALGRNVGAGFGKLQLLPCEILEFAELKQADELERVRFTVAGITTEYEGRNYLLLQKATQCYNHGNFGR
jgi:hypothetical protein